jgi:hypothetical protein
VGKREPRNLSIGHTFSRHENRFAFHRSSARQRPNSTEHGGRGFALGLLANSGGGCWDLSVHVFLPNPEFRSRRSSRCKESASGDDLGHGATGERERTVPMSGCVQTALPPRPASGVSAAIRPAPASHKFRKRQVYQPPLALSEYRPRTCS